MTHVTIHGFGDTIIDFCKKTKIPIEDFRLHMGEYKEADKIVWAALMEASVDTARKDPQFYQFDFRQQLLSVYYLFFENCGLNAAYCTASIDHHGKLQMVSTLTLMKHVFTDFINQAYQSDSLFQSSPIGQVVNKIGDRLYGEGFYSQLLFLLEFWHNDTSPEYEKTDLAIEKGVKAACDLMDVTPVKSIFDFGKFIWQERIQK